MTKINNLRAERETIIAQVARTRLAFQTLKDDQSAIQNIEIRHDNLVPQLAAYNDVQSQIEALNKQELESDQRLQFENEYYSLLGDIKRHLTIAAKQGSRTANSETTSTAEIQAKIKLPELNLPIFNGDFNAWISFRETFTSLIHDNHAITSIQKFHYLKSCLRDEPRQLLDSIPVSSENYNTAFQLLVSRYHNKRLIIKTHVNAIFNLKPVTKDSASSLHQLMDHLTLQLKILNSLELPTEHWDVLIIHIIKSKFDINTLKEWETHNQADIPTLTELTAFVKNRCRLLESITIDKSSFNPHAEKPVVNKNVPRRSNNVQLNTVTCPVCSEGHRIYNCANFHSLTPSERIAEASRLRLCKNCLGSKHAAPKCNSYSCRICQKRHHTLLHLPNATVSTTEPALPRTATPPQANLCNTQSVDDQVLLSTAIILVKDAHSQFHEMRALLDVGAQSNFITIEAVRRLNLPTTDVNLSISGVSGRVNTINKTVKIKFKSLHNAYNDEIACLLLPKITDNVPICSIKSSQLKIPANIKLADPKFHTSQPIDMLLGAEIFWNLLCIGQIKSKGQPILHKTHLGWLVGGKIHTNLAQTKHTQQQNVATINLHSLEQQVSKFWSLEEISNKKLVSKREEYCESHFRQTYTIGSDGRFIVRLPFKPEAPPIGQSMEIAIKRFNALERKLLNSPQLSEEYSLFLNTYKQLGHMSKLHDYQSNKNTQGVGYFLPHHAVVNESSLSTKFRVVFDGSCKTTNGQSLNEILMVGPTIQPELFNILLRFRTHNYVIIADIIKMYRQIWVHEDDRCYQQIVWRDSVDQPLETYILNTITYGTSPASFLAIRCLNEVAYLERDSNPIAAEIIPQDFYVDNLFTGAKSRTEVKTARDQIISVLGKYGLELSQWASNDPELLSNSCTIHEIPPSSSVTLDKDEYVKTLGLLWNHSTDDFHFSTITVNPAQKVTKRTILSITSKIFDPLGLINPVTLLAKVLIQSLWCMHLSWDEVVPVEALTVWQQVAENIPALRTLTIPRKITPFLQTTSVELHGFSDASEKAYGACLYLRTTAYNGEYAVRLLCAKSRVAPLKTISLPRLELCGALLLAKLTTKITQILRISMTKVTLWTDSTIVLAWIASEPYSYNTFVANRISEIQELTEKCHWHHVSSKDNPADILSRGTTPDKLMHATIWWQGPSWLVKPSTEWPVFKQSSSHEHMLELRANKALIAVTIHTLPILTKISSWTKLKRIIAYTLRFVHNCRNPTNRSNHPLKCHELNQAEVTIIKMVQMEAFASEVTELMHHKALSKTSKLKALSPFMDPQGLIRVGGRLKNANLSHDHKHPWVLPSHHVTNLIITYEHVRLLHAGNELTLASLRHKFWILSGRSLIRKITHKCLKCYRTRPKTQEEIMGNLPASRVTPSRAFTVSGIDYGGPLLIKPARGRGVRTVKAYIALFVCFATKATHIELVGDLTTDSFLGALKRFIARRGHVAELHSDNATNFVGANRQLQELKTLLMSQAFEENIIQNLTAQGIVWHFIPPRSPHHGGIWEAGIKSVKGHLKRVIGDAILTYEELYTVLTCIESSLNSRPLTPISNDPNDLSCLTPSHFLIGDALTALPEPDTTSIRRNALSRWQLTQQISQAFWKRWSNEYLSQMQQRTKWQREGKNPIKVDSLVLIKEDNSPPLTWKMGRVVEVFPGNDNKGRVARVKTANGSLIRAITKLCLLPLFD